MRSTVSRLVLALIASGCVASAALAGPLAIEAGQWHRTITFNVKNPLLSKLLAAPVQSDVCIDARTASGGPLAVVTVEDGPECRLVRSNVHGEAFTARRVCRMESGKQAVYDLTGQFSGQSIKLSQIVVGEHGPDATPYTELHRTGPCLPTTPRPRQ